MGVPPAPSASRVPRRRARGLNLPRVMPVRSLFLIVVFIASAASADWRNVAPGVDYQEYRGDTYDIHVTRVNVASDQIRIVVSNESDKGLKVSDYAKKVSAIAAINGDYFDDHFNPVGYTIGPCGPWTNVKDMKREIVLQIANQHGVLRKRTELGDAPDPVDAAISGWPVLVADGRRTGVPGLTLAQLADFMADKLDVCSAMNLDGGGSAAMWVGDHIVNRPSDGVERGVGDHIAVVLSRDYMGCVPPPQKTSSATQR